MGAGDWLMAAGEARVLHKSNLMPVLIVGRDGRPQWNDIFHGIPYILRRPIAGQAFSRIVNGPGVRPYIVDKTVDRWVWRQYRPKPAKLQFQPHELAFAEQFRGLIMVEPNIKAQAHENKAWIWSRWQELVARYPDQVVQCGASGARFLDGVHPAITPSFRMAAAVLSVCRAFVGTEGGLHHAAAAVGTPAVVLWSEFISPNVTGYDSHRNIRHAGKACGSRLPCRGCEASMRAIEVDEVDSNLKELING